MIGKYNRVFSKVFRAFFDIYLSIALEYLQTSVEYETGKICKTSPYFFISISFNQCEKKNLFAVSIAPGIALLLSALDFI